MVGKTVDSVLALGKRVFRLALPAMFWVFTAAPSFVVPDRANAFDLAYAPATSSDSSMAGQLFDRQLHRPVIDTAIESIYAAMSDRKLDDALRQTERLIDEFPNFYLAHMIRGDILSLKAGRPLQTIGDIPNVPRNKVRELEGLRAEAIARFRAVKDKPSKSLLPAELVQMHKDQRFLIMVDTSRSRLYLYENAFPHPRLVTDFYISQGRAGAIKVREGDRRTPIGVYTITELLPRERLTDFYGPIALPIDYPNSWDKRLGKTGHGIWLHGMPSNFVSRPPRDSDGCVVLANDDLLALKKFVDIGNTQVVISERMNFVPVEVWQSQRKAALETIRNWRDDLQAGFSKGAYHYAQDVIIDGKSLTQWQREKQISERSLGRIKIEDLNVMRYPHEKDEMMLVNFVQKDAQFGKSRKQQYWMRIGTGWKIVQEETTPFQES